MDNGSQIDVEKVASEPPHCQEAVDLASLYSYYDIYNIYFTSHRKILGWPIIFAKKLLRRLLTPILERQLTYNTANTRLISALWRRSDTLQTLRTEMAEQQGAALQTLCMEMAEQQGAALQTLRTEMAEQQGAALQTLRTEMAEQQGAALQTLRTEMAEQQGAALQTLRMEMAEQQGAALQTLRTEMAEQQGAVLQTLPTEMAEQIEKVGQQRALAFQAIREAVVGQVERLGQQQATAMQVLREMVVEQIERLGQQLHNELAEQDTRIVQQKAQLMLQERRITMLLEEARKRLPEPFSQEQLQIMMDEGKCSLEALYMSFEDQFRGTREDIKERCRVYLPLVKESELGTDEMPILDLGCGRGEWLELLREEGLQAQGLDINPILVEECRKRELAVVVGDIIAYLRTLPGASVGGVTGFHIIEHLPLEVLINTLDETVRVLKPGGLAIFETPNPQNVLVGSCNFYIDPTHRRPLHSQMIQFLAEARGLCHIKILYLHPSELSPLRENTEVAKRFNEYFYGPMDYAIVGRRV